MTENTTYKTYSNLVSQIQDYNLVMNTPEGLEIIDDLTDRIEEAYFYKEINEEEYNKLYSMIG